MRHRDAGVVGFDIAGSEAGNPPTRHLDAFQLVAARELPHHHPRRRGVRAAIDLGGRAALRSRAPRSWRAHRRRHRRRRRGRATLGRLASFVRDRRVPLEMCPTSNVNTGVVRPPSPSTRSASSRRLRFRVTVNTDNRLMSGVSLTSEMAVPSSMRSTTGWDEMRVAHAQRHEVAPSGPSTSASASSTSRSTSPSRSSAPPADLTASAGVAPLRHDVDGAAERDPVHLDLVLGEHADAAVGHLAAAGRISSSAPKGPWNAVMASPLPCQLSMSSEWALRLSTIGP